MGQSTSAGQRERDLEAQHEESRPIHRVDTIEKFQRRFKDTFRIEAPSSLEEHHMSEALGLSRETGCEICEMLSLSWDEHTLIDFFDPVIPVDLKAEFKVAAPFLLKTMIRLGFFPFHMGPTPSTLGVDELFVAVFFLQREHEDCLFDYVYEVISEEVQQQRDKYFRRLLFQVMSNKQDQAALSVRDPADDEDLILARNLLQEHNRGRDLDNPKISYPHPPIMAVSELPSSRSRDMTGAIPREEFQALLNVLFGISNQKSVDVAQLIETYGTEWNGFDAMFTEIGPRFSTGISQLFDIFTNFGKNWGDMIVDLEDKGLRKRFWFQELQEVYHEE